MGSNEGVLQVGEQATYIAFYIIEQSAAVTSEIINSAQVFASSHGFDGEVSDISDDGDDTDGNLVTILQLFLYHQLQKLIRPKLHL